jgi:hypothetical protein
MKPSFRYQTMWGWPSTNDYLNSLGRVRGLPARSIEGIARRAMLSVRWWTGGGVSRRRMNPWVSARAAVVLRAAGRALPTTAELWSGVRTCSARGLAKDPVQMRMLEQEDRSYA